MLKAYKASFLGVALLSLSACAAPQSDFIPPEVKRLACDDYQSVEVDDGLLYNNVWNKGAAKTFDWSQCLVQKTDGSAVGWMWHWPQSGRQIFAYPQIKRGSSPWDPLPKIDDRFPVQLGSLDGLRVRHSLDVSSNGIFNVATSFWLTRTDAIGDVPNKDIIAAEIMVWTYAAKGHINPAGRKIGILTDDAGQDWSIWLDENWGDASGENENRWVILTFKAEDPSLTASFDLAILLGDPRLAHLSLSNVYVADVELGTEIMRGSGVAWVERFDVDVIPKTP